MHDNEFTKILGWPGYRVYRHEINETAKTLRLWVRRKRGNRKLICSGCGRKFSDAHDFREREVRDLPWGEYRTTVIIEVYRMCCPQCGVRVEKVPQLPSKAPFSKRFEEAVGLACESASVRQVARQFRLAASTVRAIDLRYLQRWSATRNLFGSGFYQTAVGLVCLRSNVAGMIQQFFPICQIPAFFVDLACENDKSLSPISPSQPDNHQCTIAHIAR